MHAVALARPTPPAVSGRAGSPHPYRVRREIAVGGMGTVLEAEHVRTGRVVALKRLRGDLAGDERARARLLREARALGAVRHPGVVEILDAAIERSGEPYLVLEMLEGRPLDGVIVSRHTLAVDEAVRIVLEACDAIACAHDHGIVHRDLKPGNLFLARTPGGGQRVKVLDFGNASLSGPESATHARKVTRAGELLGTPEYMPPEHVLQGAPIDVRGDVYALGIILFECLTGQVPFAGSYAQVLLAMHASSAAPSARARRLEVPEGVDLALRRALAKDPAQRFQDVRAFAAALEAALRLARTPAAQGDASAPARRRAARTAYVTPVSIILRGGERIDGRSEDISEGGLLVVTPKPCRDGEAVRVRFALPITGQVVTLPAIARWVRSARDGRGAVGLELLTPPSDARQTIARYAALMG